MVKESRINVKTKGLAVSFFQILLRIEALGAPEPAAPPCAYAETAIVAIKAIKTISTNFLNTLDHPIKR